MARPATDTRCLHVRRHIGNMGVAPKFKPSAAVNSIPPSNFGGNIGALAPVF
jgi:acetamidase/formamidase